MKAYCGELRDDPDAGMEIVFANTVKEAKRMIWGRDFTSLAESYLDLIVRRYPAFDGMETLTPKELSKVQWRDGWWFHQSGYPDPDEGTDEDFDKWYDETFGIPERKS